MCRLEPGAARAGGRGLVGRLCVALRDRLAANALRIAPISAPPKAGLLAQWFLELCDRPDRMAYLYLDNEADTLQVRLGTERPQARDYGLRLHGADLMALLEGRILLEHITLGGAFRYHSPRSVDDLERIRGRVFGPLHTLLGMG